MRGDELDASIRNDGTMLVEIAARRSIALASQIIDLPFGKFLFFDLVVNL